MIDQTMDRAQLNRELFCATPNQDGPMLGRYALTPQRNVQSSVNIFSKVKLSGQNSSKQRLKMASQDSQLLNQHSISIDIPDLIGGISIEEKTKKKRQCYSQSRNKASVPKLAIN